MALFGYASTRIYRSTSQLSHCQGFIFMFPTVRACSVNLCNQCLTEFLKIRTCFKIVG